MERFTISLDQNLATAFDDLIKERGYATRSEAVRDILRTHLQQSREQRDTKGSCVANLSYVYNHHERELSERLANIQREAATKNPLLTSISRLTALSWLTPASRRTSPASVQ